MGRRTIYLALVCGLVAAGAVVLIGASVVDDGPDTDGSFVLTESGVFQQPADEVNEDGTGEALPDVTLSDADGELIELSSYAGRPTVINLWFSSCVPCQRELVDFAAVHDEYGDRVNFVGVNPFDTVETMLRFADERGVTYDLLRDTERRLSLDLGIIGYPVTLFVDSDGEIVRQTGEIDAEQLRATIDEVFSV